MLISLLCSLQSVVQSYNEVEDNINSSHFPQGFLFGTSTSSYQIEGAYLEDGKGLNNWDVFTHIPGNIINNENGDTADDHYHRYMEDIELLSSLGVNAYRFSISWARILPRGIYGEINPNGIIFYNKIIDNLLLRGTLLLIQAKQGGTIGIIVSILMYEPLEDEEWDRRAASRALAFHSGWALDPLVFGEYPTEMRHILGNQLPSFSDKEKSLIKGSLDFLGINHYSTLYAKDCLSFACSPESDRPISGFLETTGMRDDIPIGIPNFFVVPMGLEKIVDHISTKYPNMPLFITENGYSTTYKQNETMFDLLQDLNRVEYHKAYLTALLRAIK
ncbi:beta-glucosidase 18-like protein [Senna tora]|uniref:Beta-glucosidase 18-like protein n=1 Tax=Senna tora TaxID=362788 RepID=A0A834TIC5_9FABA|nr:beta-glucosidase 18-like protein [Senna tora]